jgi:hypothetical protein
VASYAAFHVEGVEERAVAEQCAALMRTRRGALRRWLRGDVRVAAAAYAPDLVGRHAVTSGRPTRLVVYRQSARWVSVVCNRFEWPNALAAQVSEACGCTVVDTKAQTSSDVYAIVVYQRGRAIRTLEYGRDEGWATDTGNPLPNEPVPLERRDRDEPDDAETWFDRHAVEHYLQEVFDLGWWEPPRDGTPAFVVE